MARAKQNQKATTVRSSTSSRGVRARSRSSMAVLIVSALAALWAAVMLTGAGQRAYAYGFFFTEFFAGVVTLVSLSLTVMLGLLATDRLVLLIRHRVLLQSAHRATGVLGVVGLLFHVLTKIATGRAASTDAVVPFVSGSGLYVGLGTVAALLMVSVLWTGIIRARFAGVGPKWLWRTLHSTAYVAWPFALLHGLYAGRPAKSWVMVSYLTCLLLVALALLVRLSVTLGRRSREQHQAAAMNQALVGRSTDDGRGRSVLAGLGRRAEAKLAAQAARERREAEWAQATAQLSVPAGGRRHDPERFTVPVVPEPGTLREPVRPGRRQRDEETAAPTRSRRRRADEPTPSRSRDRSEEVETTRSRRRRAEEPAVTRSRTPSEEVEPSRSRRRRADDEVDAARYATTSRRRSDEPEEPWTSPRRWEAAEPVSAEPISAGPVSAGPVSGTPISVEPRSGAGRHSAEEDVPEEPDYWRPPARYAPEPPPVPVDDTPTLVDLASRRARRAAGEGRSGRRKRANANADAVDGAYWAGLRGEAK
ncbi:hypothetical protein GA0070620_5872 [Micromonospora krabiensis]|uniref:DMSO/TMAO reductase YedYZ, heme-binding membrane subunit n=2 Tax=Micromonospora krabiensis TaxID=307121 RepID=A0A1C3NCF6_9ACTN|nr:hypothetical protein GA0070620_5872 [Micromonospora krabiensis]